MDFQQTCLDTCGAKQVVNINMAFNDASEVNVLDVCSTPYDPRTLEWAFSVDGVCWSCYMPYDDLLANTIEMPSDFYLRIKVPGTVTGVTINDEPTTDYSTSIAEGFNFSYCSTSTSSNQYNPYINMDGAMALYANLTESVSCMLGIPIYYFKLAPSDGSKDLTFKEYALYNVESVKQIKLMVNENQMPSSKPEFSDFGIDFQTDWETYISKGMFATAFGVTAQPMEGDLIYIPMMKRMWMVNGAYEEKRDAFMWNATYFTLALVKYQEKGSVDLAQTEAMVSSFVKNKYEDLFGDDEGRGAQYEAVDSPTYIANGLYPVYESDAMRKYMSCDYIDYQQGIHYYRGTMISDSMYQFMNPTRDAQVIYQKRYCGEDGVMSFIIKANQSSWAGTLLEAGHIKILISQDGGSFTLTLANEKKCTLKLRAGVPWFVYCRWSRMLNTVELCAARYTHMNVPVYKLQDHHYYFDIDNPEHAVARWSIEMVQETPGDIILHSFSGAITNIKVFDVYNDNVSEILQMYPTHQHLIVNDTARKVADMNGIEAR